MLPDSLCCSLGLCESRRVAIHSRLSAGQFNEATSDVSHALEFLKDTYVDDLDGYDGDSLPYIVAVLRERYPCNASKSNRPSAVDRRASANASARLHRNNHNHNRNDNDDRLIPSDAPDAGDSVAVATPDVATSDGGSARALFDAAREEHVNVGGGWTTDALGGAIRAENSSAAETKSNNGSSGPVPAYPDPSHFEADSYAERLLEIAHIFHFVSIAILGIFVIQVGSPAVTSRARAPAPSR